METKEQVFRIRSYGFSQLAQMYCPDIARQSASSRLRRWLSISKQLQTQLKEAGYRKGARLFTPRQVKLIVEHLGEPDL